MAGNFVVSLDFELMWGVRDHRTAADYGDAVLGVRSALPALLQRFKAAGIRATWATVGLLFARTRREMLDHAPEIRPAYSNATLSPYRAIETEIGEDEDRDPLHYGRSLLDRIAETDGQEIATHTFSHYYCLEEGQTLQAFDADLKAAISIAASAGHRLSSIVFPRNQMQDAHIRCCVANGLACYRGNPAGFAYRSRPGNENHFLVRGARLLDGVAPIMGPHSFGQITSRLGLANIPASRFLRPWSRRFPLYSRCHVETVRKEMHQAASRGENYHLWWHPHNVGRNQERNLHQIDQILGEYLRLRDEFGFSSRTMREFASEAERPGNSPS